MTAPRSDQPRTPGLFEAALAPFIVAAVGTALCMAGLNSLGFLDLFGALWWGLVGPGIVGLVAGAVSARGARLLGLFVGLAGACAVTVFLRSTDRWTGSLALETGVWTAAIVCVLFTLG